MTLTTTRVIVGGRPVGEYRILSYTSFIQSLLPPSFHEQLFVTDMKQAYEV